MNSFNSNSSNSGSSNNGSPMSRFRRRHISTPNTSTSISGTPNNRMRILTPAVTPPSPIAAHALNFGTPVPFSPMAPEHFEFGTPSSNGSSPFSSSLSAISATSPHVIENMNISAPSTPVRAPPARRRLNFGSNQTPSKRTNGGRSKKRSARTHKKQRTYKKRK